MKIPKMPLPRSNRKSQLKRQYIIRIDDDVAARQAVQGNPTYIFVLEQATVIRSLSWRRQPSFPCRRESMRPGADQSYNSKAVWIPSSAGMTARYKADSYKTPLPCRASMDATQRPPRSFQRFPPPATACRRSSSVFRSGRTPPLPPLDCVSPPVDGPA